MKMKNFLINEKIKNKIHKENKTKQDNKIKIGTKQLENKKIKILIMQ